MDWQWLRPKPGYLSANIRRNTNRRKMEVIVITVDENNQMEMTTNVSNHDARIKIMKAAILKDLKPNTLTQKLKKR